jgi:hypothetical protein
VARPAWLLPLLLMMMLLSTLPLGLLSALPLVLLLVRLQAFFVRPLL